MLDALWELARVPALPPKLVHQAMNEHLTILNESATRDQVRENYAQYRLHLYAMSILFVNTECASYP